MKAVYVFEEDGVQKKIHIDNISRIRQKGDHISLIERNEKVKLHISERSMRRNNGRIELSPDDAGENMCFPVSDDETGCL